MNHDIIQMRELKKRFPKRTERRNRRFWTRLSSTRRPPREWLTAVDGIKLDIKKGEIFGLLGPNGAGKTTTIKMLCTLLEPTSGTAQMNGYDIITQADLVRQSLGAVLTGERSIYWKLTGRENLAYFSALYHIPPSISERRINELLDRLEMSERADELVERYSSGMKQRIAIAKALLANPPVLLLDEPTIGLDPQSARNLRELILEIRQEGTTILLTTHYMDEADQLCDRVGIIDLGKIIALDSPARLKRSIEQLDIVQLEVENYDPTLTDVLNQLPTVQNVISHHLGIDSAWSIALHTTDSDQLLPDLVDLISSNSGRMKHLQIVQPTLEDVFISLTGKQLRD